MKLAITILTIAVIAAAPVQGQQSASFSLTEHVFNAGGAPSQGSTVGSASYRVTVAAIGDAVSPVGLTSGSYAADVSFVLGLVPPGEVENLRFADGTTLLWDAERSVGHYNLYRGMASTLPSLGYGACLDPLIPMPTATDPASPPPDSIYFYLVTAENRLGEEGTKGYSSSGVERHGSDCP